MIVSSSEPETMVLPSGEKATDMTQVLCALGFSALSSSVAAEEGKRAWRQLRARGEGQAWPLDAPESHTLIVPPLQADTILEPSGEKATELIMRLWAFCFSVLSSRVPVECVERA